MLENEKAPLTPANCHLAGFDYMPLDVDRLRKSRAWLIAKRRPELAFYMINLWTAAWKETPAASLEDDDDVLADAAMCSPERWPELKVDVLRGFVLCSDGRLYHELIAIKALEAWLEKLGMRISSGHGNAKRYGSAFDDTHLREQVQIARGMLFALDPDSKHFTKKAGHPTSAAPAKKASRSKSATSRKPASGNGSDADLPTGAAGDADHDADGIKAGSQFTPTYSTPLSIGGKPPITPPDATSASSDDLGGAASNAGGDEAAAGQLDPEGADAPGEPMNSAEAAKPSAKEVKDVKSIELPDWMPATAWAEFVAMRKSMGRAVPFTVAAARGIVRKLTELRSMGHDPAAVLDQSTRNSWRDVFALKAPNPSTRAFSTRQTAADRRADTIAGLTGRRTHPHSNQGDRHDHIDVDARVVG